MAGKRHRPQLGRYAQGNGERQKGVKRQVKITYRASAFQHKITTVR
jgi:hypothetical protein